MNRTIPDNTNILQTKNCNSEKLISRRDVSSLQDGLQYLISRVRAALINRGKLIKGQQGKVDEGCGRGGVGWKQCESNLRVDSTDRTDLRCRVLVEDC